MTVEDDFTDAMLNLYQRTGVEVGYWAYRFNQEVKKKGGQAVAKRLLKPGGKVSTGFERLLDVRRADLAVEHLVLAEKRFHELFTSDELAEARRRLDELPPTAFPSARRADDLYPDELPPDREYVEGAKRQSIVNAYERDPAARSACIRYYQARCPDQKVRCVVCSLAFEERYGALGEGFIHVHHLRPFGLSKSEYRVNPKKDMVPVCPNCHAMLHRQEPPLTPDELKDRMRI